MKLLSGDGNSNIVLLFRKLKNKNIYFIFYNTYTFFDTESCFVSCNTFFSLFFKQIIHICYLLFLFHPFIKWKKSDNTENRTTLTNSQ